MGAGSFGQRNLRPGRSLESLLAQFWRWTQRPFSCVVQVKEAFGFVQPWEGRGGLCAHVIQEAHMPAQGTETTGS
jgi:hypothetical protein